MIRPAYIIGIGPGLCELRRTTQPVEKAAVRPVDRQTSIQTLGKHCQDAAKAGRSALEHSSEGCMEEFFNGLTPPTHSGE